MKAETDNYKIIILGSQCSGKSALIEHLQSNTNLTCIDHDDEIKKRSGGIYPKDQIYVTSVLLPEIESYIISLPNIIYTASFFGLGKNGIDNSRIDVAKKAGFKFVNMTVDMDILLSRNDGRMKEGKDDSSHSLNWYQKVYTDMNELGQFDFTIYSNASIEETTEELMSFVLK